MRKTEPVQQAPCLRLPPAGHGSLPYEQDDRAIVKASARIAQIPSGIAASSSYGRNLCPPEVSQDLRAVSPVRLRSGGVPATIAKSYEDCPCSAVEESHDIPLLSSRSECRRQGTGPCPTCGKPAPSAARALSMDLALARLEPRSVLARQSSTRRSARCQTPQVSPLAAQQSRTHLPASRSRG